MLTRRSKVLIVDDEDSLVLALHRALYQDNDRVDVLLARSAEIAQQILAEMPIDVLVTDVHLPERSGMDLLSWVSESAPSTRVIVMTAFDVTGIKDRAHAFGCLRLMRKPFDVNEMRAAINRALSMRDTFNGSLAELSCVDVIQMLCLARKSTALRLSEGQSAGFVFIEKGEPVHAMWEDLVGEDAFFRMLGVKNGLFHTAPLPPDVERSIKSDWQYLLIEGLRRLDESALADGDRPSLRPASARDSIEFEVPSRPRSAPPASGAVTLGRSTMGSMLRPTASTPGASGSSGPPPSAPPQAAPDVTRLIDEGFSSLRAGRREEARRAWEQALRIDPGNRMVELNLKKLGPAVVRESTG